MVSVPTSGVQLAKAAVVFNSIFSVVGIKSGPTTPSQMLGNGSFCLEKVQVNLKNSVEEVADNKEDAAEIEVEKSLPAFLLESLKITVQAKGGREQCRNYSMTISHVDHVSNDVKFYMDVKQIHQHLDFKFVRLVLQLSETMRVVKVFISSLNYFLLKGVQYQIYFTTMCISAIKDLYCYFKIPKSANDIIGYNSLY